MQQTKYVFKPASATLCSECIYWKKERKGIKLIMGKCLEPSATDVLGEDTTTFNTNYCWRGVKK